LTLVASACGLLLFLLLAYPLLRGNIYQGSDLGSQQFPYRSFYRYCLENGYSFLWWPQQFCGYYLHAEGQGAFFHPFQWTLYRFLPLQVAFNVEFMTSYVFLFAGMVALLRHYRLPCYAALWGANLFTFSGFTLYHYTHIQAVTVISHLPWILLTVHILLNTHHAAAFRRAWLGLCLLIASQLLSGYPQYVLFTLMALALYLPFQLPENERGRRLIGIVSAPLMGLAIAAVQVLPTFDLIRFAQRSGEAEFWKEGSLHPLNLLQWVSPYWFANGIAHGTPPWEYVVYVGAVPIALTLWLLGAPPSTGHTRRLRRYGFVLLLLMPLLALGHYGGLYRLIAMLPVLGAFRCPARHLVLFQFAVALLSAVALALLAQGTTNRHTKRLLWTIGTAAWATFVLVTALRNLGTPEISDAFTTHWGRLLVGPALITLALGMVSLAPRFRTGVVAALILFATLDAALYTMPFVWQHRPQSSSYGPLQSALTQELPDDPAFEPFDGEYRAHGNWRVARLSQLGLSSYMGYVGLPPAWVLDPDLDITKRLAGVRWEKQPLGARNWTVREDALPLARLLSRAVYTQHPGDAIQNIDVTTTALVTKPLQLAEAPAGTLTWIKNEPGCASWNAVTPNDQLLVFAQRFHPGWQAHVDGTRREVLRVNGDFMGCVVPPGEHKVTFEFAPKSFRWGRAISLLGFLLTVGIWCALVRRDRRKYSSPSPTIHKVQ